MATIKKYDLCVVVDTYKGKDGKPKNKYLTIGEVMEKEDGGKYIFLHRTFNPAGVPNHDNKANVIVSMFEPKPRDEQYQQGNTQHGKAKANGFNDIEDDLPF